ncbi:uncharacterized protein [Euphorbia lathyris]|uniref:uncharacterized protein isoform X2 n=1 Tax=Euphorbia lathyris TaxID=212925 RepID=UPI0033131369
MVNESNSKCLQLESVARNSVKDLESDDKRIERSKSEILEKSEVAESGENIIHAAIQTDEAPNATITSSFVKEAESLLFEDKKIPEESSPEEKKEEGSSIMLLEEDNKENDKQTSEPVQFALEMNQNGESLNSYLQTSVATETEETLQEEPQEKMEQLLNNKEETVAGPQDDEGDAGTTKQEDVVSESNNKRLPLVHVAQESVKNFKNDGDAAEKSNTEILEQPKAVESIENITHEIDQNDSPNTITPAALAEDIESLQYEDKDTVVEASTEEKKEEPSSIKTGEDNKGSITVIEENNKEGDQDTSKTGDDSAHDMMQNEESLKSSTQASALREGETLGSDNLVLAEAFTKKDENRENYTAQLELGEYNKEDAEEILQKVTQDPIKNIKNDGDGSDKSNKEILEQPKAEESVEIADETNQNDIPTATNPAAPAEDVESLQSEHKDNAIEASAEEKKEEPSAVKTSEDSNDSIIMIEENNKEGDQETCNTDDYSVHEMKQNEESLRLSIQASPVREEETLGSDNLTPAEASIKKDEDKESYTPLIDVEHNQELLEEEEDAEQILHKDEPKENIEEPSNVVPMEIEAEALSEFKETVESQQDNEKRDAGREKDVIDESNIKSLPLLSIAENPVKKFGNDDPKEKIGQNFQDNAKNTEIPEEEDNPKEHIVYKCDIKSISREPVDQGTTKEMPNDEDNDEISNREIFEESSKGEIGESIALETNQKYEITNTAIPTAPVKEGDSLQDDSENVNLEEPALGAKKENHGPLAKASQVNGCNAELAEATKQSEAGRSHGEENMEPKLQNEPEEFLDLSSDVITQVPGIAILDKKADEISIPEDLPTDQNNEKTEEEEETKGNEDSDGSKLNDISASEDIKLTLETYYANEADLETTKAHISDYSEKNGEDISENNEKEMNEDNIIKFQGDNNEDTEKHIVMEEHLSRDISPQHSGEETNLIQENKEEIAQTETHKEFELPLAEDTTQQVLEEINIEKDQCTEPAIVIADDVAVMPKTEMHEIVQAAIANSNTGEQIMQEGREIEDILEVPLRGIDAEGLPEKDKDDENDKIKSKQEIEGIKTQLIEESAAVCYELEKVENWKDKQGSDIDLYPVKASEEGIMPKESTELDAIYLESTSKETLGKEEPCISCVIKDKSIEGVEQEDRKQLESSGPHTQEEGLERVETTGTLLHCMSINAPRDEASNLVENKDHEIQTEASRAEDLKFEIQEKSLTEGSNNHNETVAFATLSDKIPDDNSKESSLLPSNDSELMNGEESKAMDDNSARDPTIHENLENDHISQVTELADNEDKITTATEIPALALEDIGKVKENEEAESYNSRDFNQDLELHNEQYQVDQQEICKSETSKDEESSNVGDDALKCTESTYADKEGAILDKGGFFNKSEASLKEKDAAEKATDEHVAGNINQAVVTTETESSGVPAEEKLESAESSMKLDHTSEMVPSDQSDDTIPKSNPNKFEENRISECVEQISQGSPGSWQEVEEKTQPNLEAKDQTNETRHVEDIKAALFTEEEYKEVEKAEGDETVQHCNKNGDDMKELHRVSVEGEIIHEVKESGLVSSEYLKTTGSKEQTETGSLEVREGEDLEKETSVTKENQETKEEDEDYQRNIGLLNAAPSKETEGVIKEHIIHNTDSSSDKIKAASTLEEKAEPRLEDVQIDEKPVLVSNIPSDPSSPHAAETDAGQQDTMVLEENSSSFPSQLPTNEKENIVLVDIEDSRDTSDVYETRNHDVRELHTGEVREEITEAAETVHRSQEKEIVTEAEHAIDHTPPEERTKEPEVPSLALPCKEEDCRTESTIENIEKHTESVEKTKDKSMQIEVLDVSQLDLQVKKGSPESPTEEHDERETLFDYTNEEREAASATVSQSKCHSLRATEINEVADDQTLHSKKSEEQYQTKYFVLLSKELELRSSTEIKKLEETMKGEEVLEDEHRRSEEACLQKEESSELQISELDLEPKKDEEESSNEAQKEVSATSIEIENKKAASESKLDYNSKGNEAPKEEEEITTVQTNYTDKSQEENLMSSDPLLSKEQEGEASTIIGSIEEKTREMQLLEDEPNAIQDACLRKEEPRELTVPSYEFQPHIDDQESLKEARDKEDGATNGVKGEIGEVSELELKSSSQDCKAVSEDKITSNQHQPTEKSKEENQKSVAGLLFENQEHKISTIAENIGGKTTREEEPENAPKTIEEPHLQKEEPSEFKPSELELPMGDGIQKESQKKVHDGEDGTAEKSLELQSQHEIEKRNAEKMDLVALENQGETTDATEVVHTEVTNEQIIEEKSYPKNSHANAITLGEDVTKESHQHQQITEETPGAQIFEKAIQNEVEWTVETSQREVVAGLVEATEIIQNIHQQEKTTDSTLEDQISAEKEPETMASTDKKEVVEVQQEPNVETTKVTEVRDRQAEEQRIVQGVKKSVEDENGKAIKETLSEDSATISLQEMLQRSTRQKRASKEVSEEKEATASKEEVKVEKQTEQREKAKSDEEVAEEEEEEEEEEGEEQKKNDSGSDAPVMIERSRDIEVKIVQKKSHNILSGVGSKVKHSIIKVKKAITGKSSHTKQQHSPK